jgi:NitT/TauT family transport system permease protein
MSVVRDRQRSTSRSTARRVPKGAAWRVTLRGDAPIYALSVISMLVIWQIIASVFFTPLFFPTPLVVLAKGWQMVTNGTILGHIGISLQRILMGFFIGSALGAPIGLFMGNYRPIKAFFDPYLQFFRFVPSIAWLTPAVIWFGIGETPKVLIIVYTTIFIVIINTIVGVSNVSMNKTWAARSLGATSAQTFLYVILPATLPFILTGMRLAMGNSFATVVAAEMVAADKGIGFLIFDSRLWMATDTIFLAIVMLGTLGFMTDRLFLYMIRRFAHQYGPVE